MKWEDLVLIWREEEKEIVNGEGIILKKEKNGKPRMRPKKKNVSGNVI